MTHDVSAPGYAVQCELQRSFGEWVEKHGPGHALRWIEHELWPTIAERIDAAIERERAAQESCATQHRLSLREG